MREDRVLEEYKDMPCPDCGISCQYVIEHIPDMGDIVLQITECAQCARELKAIELDCSIDYDAKYKDDNWHDLA